MCYRGDEMKKCHEWQKAVSAFCPHCCRDWTYEDIGEKGGILRCPYCGKDFELGGQK